MKTKYFSVDEIGLAAELLRSSELVAFPTATVFGLGANALDGDAVGKIFVAKGRASDNPLIVHVSDVSQVLTIANDMPKVARNLMKRFWPGPLTLILPKNAAVAKQVTAGLDTVAVRFPVDKVALALIREAGVPLAAPSANRSGRPSATNWQAVAEDLDGRIAGLVCGAPSVLGLESTVVDVTCSPPRILRPGGVSLEDLFEICSDMLPYSPAKLSENFATVNSPGLKYKHYQPRAFVAIVDNDMSNDKISFESSTGNRVHFIGLNMPSESSRFESTLVCKDASEYAAKLFDFFRKADLARADAIYCEAVSEQGIGVALMDRLRRASH